jgi:hypothetical protein
MDYMSRVPYENVARWLIFSMECSNISHVVGVVSGHAAKPDKEHINGCLII